MMKLGRLKIRATGAKAAQVELPTLHLQEWSLRKLEALKARDAAKAGERKPDAQASE